MSLYLKYRPQDFQSVVGQEHAKKTLQSALSAGTMSHAYLFCGARGTGKTSMARIVAKSLNCVDLQNNEPCNACVICTAINSGRLVDVIEIDAASNRGIDEIRDLREKILFAPTQAKNKVYIIDEVHMLTKEAFNALLKTLEEPPSHSYFILATTEAHKIPETIISRTQQFSFSRITVLDIVARLKMIADAEKVEVQEAALLIIAKLSNGGLRDAIGLLEQMMTSGEVTVQTVTEHLGLTGVDHLEKFFQALQEKDPFKAMDILTMVKSSGASINQFAREILGFMREKMLLSLAQPAQVKESLHLIELFTHARQQMDLSPIPELPLEMAILKACNFTSPPMNSGEKAEEKIESTPEIKPPAPLPHESIVADISQDPLSDPTPLSPTEINLETVKKNWPRVVENIKTPFLTMSLKDAQPMDYQEPLLTLCFTLEVYLEKFQTPSHQDELIQALEKVFQKKFKLKLELKTVNVSIQNDSKTPTIKVTSPVDLAAEVFGVKG